MPADLAVIWPYLTSGSALVLAALASAHAVLRKREVRAAIGWVAIVWLVPIVGPLLYYVLGINRIERRASRLRPDPPAFRSHVSSALPQPDGFELSFPEQAYELFVLKGLGDRLSGLPLVEGNRVAVLDGGDEAYAAMIAAIDDGERSIALSSYIIDHDEAGLRFAVALEQAVERGLEVRVLIDGIGALYSWKSMVAELSGRGITVAKFLHSYIPWRMAYFNLRSHRKLLVVDGRIGFTGGMNIRIGHILKRKPKRPVRDTHFQFEGPVVAQMMDVFADDWLFTTEESLDRDRWYGTPSRQGPVFARAISDGPDEVLERIAATLHGALSQARREIRLVTPYFLPDRVLIAALRMAALRGVRVQIVMPAASNLPVVDWAARAQIWQVMEPGCEVWLSPPPFDHSKLLVVDGAWSLVGSTNWDPRSIRLNFEFNVECFDVAFAQTLNRIVDGKLDTARRLTEADVLGRGLPVRLRDGAFWLLSPYL